MFRSTFEEWLENLYWPVMGAEGEEDPETPAGGEEEDPETPVGEEDEPTGAAGGSEEDSSDDEDDDPSSGEDADEAELERVRNERDRLRQQVASAEAAVQKAKKEARKAREEAAKKGGNWEQVAKEREAELAEANERAQEADKRAIVAEESLDTFKREVRITRLASRLSFRDPADAISQLKDQTEVTGDDKSCERALRKLAEAKPYLIDQRRARGRAMGDGNGSGGLTTEQLKTMSPEEVNRYWETGQVQSVLSRGVPSRS